jgi:uncharacterized membrane protein YhdT
MTSKSDARYRVFVPSMTLNLLGLYYFLATLASAYLVVASATGQMSLNFWQAIAPLWVPIAFLALVIGVITTIITIFVALVYGVAFVSSVPRRVRTAIRGLRPKPKGQPTHRREPAKRYHHLHGGPLPDTE